MIEVKINGVAKWQVNEYTFNDPQMGIRSINMTVKHPSMWVDGVAPDTADFTGAYVDYEGEKYSISSSKPTAEKSNTSLDYIYTLIFKGEEEELTRRKVRNLALVSFDNYVSQGTTFSIYADINQFKQLLENNLKHYFGNKWSINLSVLSSDSVRIDVSNATLWDLLSKTYEYFGVRFNIRGNTINIGYEPEEIYHVFDYGNDGGLVKITKTAPDTSIVNRLSGMGGSRNVPMNYFTNRYSDFAPDPNPINSSVNIRNIMPKVFRDSVVSGDYKDYVEDLTSIASHGVREDALAPNEDIYPSIAGVEVSGLGRIDEIIAVSEVIADKPDDNNYSPTFHIWVKDIGFNLADEQYTSTQDAKISFTTGVLTGYEFTILANGKIREVVEDSTKSLNGVSSKYRITLINSDEDFDATGRVLPNTVLKPSAGDHFVIYDIEMPFSYVANAEQRVQDWLEANLADLKEEKPTFSIEPMPSFFETALVEFDGKTIKEKLRAGNRITVNTDIEHRLHINNLTIQYGGLMPKYSFTVTDRVQVQGSTVARMQSQLDGVMSRQLLTERDIEALLSGFSTKYLSKVKPDIAQQFISFLKGISVKDLVYLAEGLEIGNYTSGLLGSGAKFKMNEGISELEVDKLSVRMRAEFFSVLIHNAKHIGGELVMSPAEMMCIKVEETPNFYRCYFDADGGKVINLFTNKDFARCQIFTGVKQKFYWRKVVAVGTDYIELSKTDAVAGSDIPEIGDTIFQLGSLDPERQSAMIFSTVGYDAPSFKQYKDIDSMSLEGKDYTIFSGKGNKIVGKTVFMSDGSDLDNWSNNITGDIQDAQSDANEANRKAQEAIDKGIDDMADINSKLALMQEQLDGQVSNWFYPYVPTLDNFPASDWITDEEKDNHIGDTFTNTEPAPASNSGKSWRFVKEDGIYKWVQISDSDALLALQKAMEALTVADGKSTTYLVQPSNYDVGDMWVLGEARVVNGVSYKQGDLLTALIGRDVFRESDWVKRVRYTDDSAVDALEIGGRNLITGTYNNWRVVTMPAAYGIRPPLLAILDDWRGKRVTHAFEVKDVPAGEAVRIRIDFHRNASDYVTHTHGNIVYIEGKSYVTYTIPADTQYTMIRMRVSPVSFTSPYNFLFRCEKLEFGNKATDWSPAPEDIQAEIDLVQSNVNTVSTSLSNLNTYIDGAFKDGVIDSAEATTIAQLIKTVQAENDKMLATYDKLFLNSYLEGTAKTSLQQNKITFVGAVNDVITAINTAIADNTITPTERTNVNNKFNAYKTALADFSTSIENANKAIQDKLDSLSKGYVDELEIGGRNLIVRHNEIKNTWINTQGVIVPNSTTSTMSIYIPVIPGDIFTFSKKTDNSPDGGAFRWRWFDENENYLSRTATLSNIFTWVVPNGTYYIQVSYPNSSEAQPKLEKGNKPTDWSPAPEDVQAEINQAKQEALTAANNVQTNVNSLNTYVTGAFKDGVISEAEAKAIEKYKNSINESMSKAEASFAKVFANTYLEGTAKTALENAKINLWGQRDTLLSTINTAIADGKTTVAEKNAVDSAFNTFNNLMSAFQSALEEANKAIQAKLDSLSKGYVDELEIGGRNLITGTYNNWRVVTMPAAYGIRPPLLAILDDWRGKRVTHAFEVKDVPAGEAVRIRIDFHRNASDYVTHTHGNVVYIEGKSYVTYTIPADTQYTMIRMRVSPVSFTSPYNFLFRCEKLEFGNKATDWSPAPEDVQASIDEVATVKNLIIYGDFAGEMKKIKSSNPINYYPLGWGVVGAGTVGGIPSDPDNLAPTIRKISADLPKGMIAGLKITPKSNLQGVFQNVNLNLNEVHTFYVFARKVNASSTAQIRLKHGTTSVTKDLTTKWVGYVLKFTPTAQSRVEILFNKTGTWTANDEVQISKIQLAQTSEIVDYRPYSYVENAFKGSTVIEGGVVATNMVILNNEGGEIKSYVSGIDANPSAFAAGVSGFGTDTEKKNIDLRHNGSGHLASGNISWGEDGNVVMSGTYTQAISGTAKTILRTDGSGHLASGNISWDEDGNVSMSGIEATNAIFSGLVKVPFKDGNYAQSTPPNELRNYTFTNNNDLTVWYLPEDNALNGARIMLINWRTNTKTLRLSTYRFFGQWYSGDTKRYDIPANSFCEMIGLSLGTNFQGWLVTNSGTII